MLRVRCRFPELGASADTIIDVEVRTLPSSFASHDLCCSLFDSVECIIWKLGACWLDIGAAVQPSLRVSHNEGFNHGRRRTWLVTDIGGVFAECEAK